MLHPNLFSYSAGQFNTQLLFGNGPYGSSVYERGRRIFPLCTGTATSILKISSSSFTFTEGSAVLPFFLFSSSTYPGFNQGYILTRVNNIIFCISLKVYHRQPLNNQEKDLADLFQCLHFVKVIQNFVVGDLFKIFVESTYTGKILRD